MLRSCDEDVNIKSESAVTLKQLINLINYNSVNFLGSGGNAAAVLLKGDVDVVVRYSLANEQEIKNACIANELNEVSSIFPKTYGYAVCQSIPLEWLPIDNRKILNDTLRDYVERNDGTQTILFMFTTYVGQDLEWFLNNYTFNLYEAKCIVFDLLLGIAMARKKLESFSHNDIYPKNVTLSLLEPEQSIRYRTIEENEFFLQSKYQVHLIDFEHANRHTTPHTISSTWHSAWKSDDITAIALITNKISETFENEQDTILVQNFTYDVLRSNKAIKYADEWELLLGLLKGNVFFAELQNSSKRTKVMCRVCYRVARFVCGNCKSVSYCSDTRSCQYLDWNTHKKTC